MRVQQIPIILTYYLILRDTLVILATPPIVYGQQYTMKTVSGFTNLKKTLTDYNHVVLDWIQNRPLQTHFQCLH